MHLLPDEVLLSILRLACAENALYAYSFARVSRQWRRLCKDPSVYRAIDLSGALPLSPGGASSEKRHTSVNDALLVKVAGLSWSELSELNLAGCPITDTAMCHLAASCRHLQTLSLGGGCKKQRVSPTGLLAIGQACGATLHTLSLAGSLTRSHAATSLHAFLPAMRGITSLDMSGCAGAGTLHGLRAVAACLPLLRHLNLSLAGSAVTAALPILDLQRGCPLLQVLDISGLGGAAGWLPVLTMETPAPGTGAGGGSQQSHGAAVAANAAASNVWGVTQDSMPGPSGGGNQQLGQGQVFRHPDSNNLAQARQQQEQQEQQRQRQRQGGHHRQRQQRGSSSPPCVLPQGFPCLRVLRTATSVHMSTCGLRYGNSRLDDKVLGVLVGQSPQLEVLEVGGTVGLTAAFVDTLPASELKELSIKKCGRAAGEVAVAAAARWGASLRRLDVSENTAVEDKEVRRCVAVVDKEARTVRWRARR
eukprot:jgi/Mesvir1/7083/Mv09191-RA.3